MSAGVVAYLALGANLADRFDALREATARIAAVPDITLLRCSRVYETPPWGKTDQPAFANAVIAIRTGLSARRLLETCLDIEFAMGRVRLERWGPRRIDIDVLTYGDARITEPHLTIPHPAMGERAFVLVPLLEIAPDFALGGETGQALLDRLDRSGIRPLDDLCKPASP